MAVRTRRLAAALLSGVLLGSTPRGGEPRSEGPSLATLAHLMEGGEKPRATRLLREALDHADPRLRGAAARVIHVINLRELEEGLREAFESEKDPAAAREEVRALAALSEHPPWEALMEQAGSVHGALSLEVLMLAARRDGPASLPLFHRLESGLRQASCEEVIDAAAQDDPGVLESAAAASLGAGQSCGWAAALTLLRKQGRWPAEPLLVQGAGHAVEEIRMETLAALILLGSAGPTRVTPGLLAVIDGEAPAEEGYLRELVRREAGMDPRKSKDWVALLEGKGELRLDRNPLHRSARGLFSGKEKGAARRRWRDLDGPAPTPATGRVKSPPRKRTLANLPPGLAMAVLVDHGCTMPPTAAVATASVSYAPSGRPEHIELLQMPFTQPCVEAATLLLRAGLVLDDPGRGSEGPFTVYIPLGKDQDVRFDELAPTDVEQWIDEDITPPKRLLFVKPEYPIAMRESRAGGKVVLQMVVDRNGVPGNIRVLKSGEGPFDRSAVLAVSQWRYQPALMGTHPVPVYLTVIVEYNFK